ncbi:MAG TPA: S8 family serine peptidase [Candidatus Obscuribacter sp.]|nr:S8 family serine peptidase [Candidatus Obscuribacter sp.]
MSILSKLQIALNRCLPVLLALTLSTAAPACLAQPEFVLKPATPTPASARNARVPQWRPNILMVMPNKGKDQEAIDSSLQEVHGEVVEKIGEGDMTVLMVKVEQQYFAEAERKLSQDKNFASVQRDLVYRTDAAVAAPVNDPYYASEWHLRALNVVNAWNVSQGGPIVIGVLDSGVNGSISELQGKTYSGYDAVTGLEGQRDVFGHGTMVSTTAAANTNNGVNTAAPARRAYIYPVRTGFSDGSISASAILKGVKRCGDLGIKIINISANGSPPYSFANQSVNSVLHTYFRWFHDTKGGLIFNSAGNDHLRDTNALSSYLIVVSAIDNGGGLASFSTYGRPVWFTAPGTGIYCTSSAGRVGSASGTSFSCPLVASVAALVWGAKPSLTNVQVENILKSTCYKDSSKQVWTESYGYGMPNAEAALKAALGL